MTSSRKLAWLKRIVLFTALACAGTWAAGQVRSMRDRSEVAKMTEKMKTVCVGRFLVDVPVHADIALSREMIDGFKVESTEEGESVFRERIARREADIEAQGVDPGVGGPGGMVEARDLRIPGAVGRVFVFGRSRGYLMEGGRRVPSESVVVEAHAHIDGISISLFANATEEASALAAEALLARLKLRGEDEIPTVPGFCIGRAMFVEPLPAHTNEQVALSLGLPGHSDLSLVLISLAGGIPSRGLLARTAEIDAATDADELLRVAKLRSGKRSINGIDGEEVLERVRELNFTTGYDFNWEVGGVRSDLLQPFLALELETGASPRAGGKPVDSSLHEDALLELWGRISSSIRTQSPTVPRPSPAPST